VRIYSGASTLLLHTLNGTVANDLFGWSISRLGDVDGEGVSDFLVGAPEGVIVMCYPCGPSGGKPPVYGPGHAKVFSGSTAGLLFTVTGIVTGDLFGYSVAARGDLNGDAVPDFAVGAAQSSNHGPGGAYLGGGFVRAFSGTNGAPLYTVSARPGTGLFGVSIASAGDLDGDGIGDLFVGALGALLPTALGFATGYAQVFSGASGIPVLTISGTTPGEYFGWTVSSAGDVNGDAMSSATGVRRILLGTFVGALSSAAGVHSQGYVLQQVFVPDPAGAFGTSVAAVGDVDGDAVPDWVVGAPAAAAAGLAGAGRAFGGSEVKGGEPTAATGIPAFALRLYRALGGAPALLIVGVPSHN
jgi:hypothetical protein